MLEPFVAVPSYSKKQGSSSKRVVLSRKTCSNSLSSAVLEMFNTMPPRGEVRCLPHAFLDCVVQVSESQPVESELSVRFPAQYLRDNFAFRKTGSASVFTRWFGGVEL